jgi:hypothetical protein
MNSMLFINSFVLSLLIVISDHNRIVIEYIYMRIIYVYYIYL